MSGFVERNDEVNVKNKLIGEVEKFSGAEKIFKNGTCVYEASYLGGLVDR